MLRPRGLGSNSNDAYHSQSPCFSPRSPVRPTPGYQPQSPAQTNGTVPLHGHPAYHTHHLSRSSSPLMHPPRNQALLPTVLNRASSPAPMLSRAPSPVPVLNRSSSPIPVQNRAPSPGLASPCPSPRDDGPEALDIQRHNSHQSVTTPAAATFLRRRRPPLAFPPRRPMPDHYSGIRPPPGNLFFTYYPEAAPPVWNNGQSMAPITPPPVWGSGQSMSAITPPPGIYRMQQPQQPGMLGQQMPSAPTQSPGVMVDAYGAYRRADNKTPKLTVDQLFAMASMRAAAPSPAPTPPLDPYVVASKYVPNAFWNAQAAQAAAAAAAARTEALERGGTEEL